MPMYITLFNFTDRAIQNIKDIKKNQKAAVERAEKLGAKLKDNYMTMGEYDGVAICEAPNDEVAVASAIAAASDGAIRTKTLRAFTTEEFIGIVEKLP